MKKLEIGTFLYRYFPQIISPGIAKYKIVGIREHKEGFHYEVECLNCQHGENCVMLVIPDDEGRLSMCGSLMKMRMIGSIFGIAIGKTFFIWIVIRQSWQR